MSRQLRQRSRGKEGSPRFANEEQAVTKSGTGTWDLGREDAGTGDSGTRGRGTRIRGDVGLGDAGTRERRTRGRGDAGTRGRGDAGTGHKDVINKQHLNYALNLKFTIFGGQEKGDEER